MAHRAWGIEQKGFAQKRIQFFTPYAPCALPSAFFQTLCAMRFALCLLVRPANRNLRGLLINLF
jgi:hypothetical protein